MATFPSNTTSTFQFDPITNDWQLRPVVLGLGTYSFVQATAALIWFIPHNLGYNPNVTVIDSSNRKVLTDIEYTDSNNLKIIVVAAFSGIAYLS